ncbi:MAG: ABC transporter permease subunit [Deltaproteobacteria bacterium]|nr:MAG: ABC transporter permease subunit [Deltaproteobacteria bacterium]
MNFYPIFEKELRAYFISPIVYGILTIYLLLSGYFFFTDLNLYNAINFDGQYNPVEGMWKHYFNDLRFVLMLVMPFITMKLVAEEKKLGTFELLTTYPVRDGEIVAGKFLASLVVFVLMMALTLTNVLFWGILWSFSGLQPLMAGYLGLFLLGCALIACGLFISSLTDNQTLAGMVTLGVFILFWFLTWNELIASEKIIGLLIRFSLFDRTEGFFQGVIDTKDVAFFVLFVFFFVFMSLRTLEARSWRGER